MFSASSTRSGRSSIEINVPIVPTTSSFATSPNTVATVACHVPKPSGANIHANILPIFSNILAPSPSSPK